MPSSELCHLMQICILYTIIQLSKWSLNPINPHQTFFYVHHISQTTVKYIYNFQTHNLPECVPTIIITKIMYSIRLSMFSRSIITYAVRETPL